MAYKISATKNDSFCTRILSVLMVLLLVVGICPMAATADAPETDAFDALRQRWLDYTIGDDSWDVTNPDYKMKLQMLEETAQKYIDLLDDTQADRIFKDYPLGDRGSWYDSDKNQMTYERIEGIAAAYATRGTRFYKDDRTKQIIIDGLDYMYEHHYNENSAPYGNWFSWSIGNPMRLLTTVMMMWEDLTPQQIENYVKPCLKWPDYGNVSRSDKTTNGIWRRKCDLYAGIVTKNADLLADVQLLYPQFLGFTNSGEGFYADGTYIYHGNHLYNGGYGTGMFRDIVEILYYLNGSQWDVSNNDLGNIYKMAYDSFIPLMAKGMMMDMSQGRDITRPGGALGVGKTVMTTLMRLAQSTKDEKDRSELYGYIKEWLSNDTVNRSFNANGTISEITLKNSLMADQNYLAIGNVQRYHQYTVGDKAVYHSEQGYAAGLGMHSNRIYNFEIGDSNRKGWNLNNGRLYLYTDDVNQYEDAVKATIDWDRLPGTTVVRGTGQTSSGTGRSGAFAGGVSLDEQYGVSAMFLRDKDNTLDAKKSYFFFDDEIVELGSGITASDSKATETILENIKLDRDNRFTVDGNAVSTALNTDVTLDNPQYLWVEGNTTGSDFGAYFPEQTTIRTLREQRSGKMSDLGSINTGMDEVLTRTYLTLYQDHGTNPVNALYSHVLLPSRTQEDVAAYSKNPDVEILAHEQDLHAVYEKSLNIVALAHYAKEKHTVDAHGVDAYIGVEGPAVVMSRESGDTLLLTVADPTQAGNGKVTVTVNREAFAVLLKDDRVDVVKTSPYIQLEINTGGSKGKAIAVELSMDKTKMPPAPTTVPEKPVLQYEVDSDGITISFGAVQGESYELYYGRESGNLTEKLELGGASAAYLTNLIDDAVYYFQVQATNVVGTTTSDELQAAFTDDKEFFVFVDAYGYLDTSKILRMNPATGWGWEYPADHADDGSCLKRPNRSSVSELVYYVEGMSGFDLNAWQSGSGGYAGKYAAITFYTAETVDEVNADSWTQVYPANIVAQDRGTAFYNDDYTIDGLEHANYLRIVIAASGNADWAPQLDRLEVRYPKNTAADTKPTGIRALKAENKAHVGKVAEIPFMVQPVTARPPQLAKIDWKVANDSFAEIIAFTTSAVSIKGIAEGTTDLIATYEGQEIARLPVTVELYRPNLALGKPAQANKNTDTDKPAFHAVDGKEDTRLGFPKTSGWINFDVDLGEVYELTDIAILWEDACPSSYKVEGSLTGANNTWVTISDRGTPPVKPDWERIALVPPVSARHLRVTSNSFVTQYGMSIWEFQVFGNVTVSAIQSLSVTPDNLKVLEGGTQQLTAAPYPEISDGTLQWESDDTSVVTVDKDTGFITGISEGSATITVKDVHQNGNGASASSVVRVVGGGAQPVLVSSIALTPADNMMLQLGETQELIAQVLPANAANKALIYSSSNTSIASVSKSGLVTAKAPGTVTINALNPASGIREKITVTVKGAEPIKYKLCFNTDGGSAVQDVEAEKNTVIQLSNYTTTKSGYRFDGWYDDSFFTNKLTAVTLTANTTVYVKWTKYSVTPPTPGIKQPIETVVPGESTIGFEGGAVEITVTGSKCSNAEVVIEDKDGKVIAKGMTDSSGKASLKLPENNTGENQTHTIKVKPQGESEYSEVTGEITVFADTSGFPFEDVPKVNTWYYDHVFYVWKHGMMNGTGENRFSPNSTMTRGMLVTVLGRAAGVDVTQYGGASFTDVDTQKYYAPYIKWADENEIVFGVGDNRFAPESSITREQVTLIFVRYAKVMNLTLPQTHSLKQFTDVSALGTESKEAIEMLTRAGVIDGMTSTTFVPNGTARRSEVAKMIHQFMATVEA